MGSEKNPSRKHSWWLSTGLVLSLLINVVIVCCMFHGGYHFMSITQNLQDQITSLQHQQYQPDETLNPQINSREKREVISVDKSVFSTLLRGPAGPPGLPGRDGQNGKDGRDFASLKLLQNVVHREWAQLSSKMATYAGVVYTRWGMSECPKTSKIIYKGFMAGPDHRAAGGGANYQCLPSDPEYVDNPPEVLHSAFTSVWYHGTVEKTFANALSWKSVPCAVCEVQQRMTKIMIPAKTRCPTGDWTLEYKGFIMTAADRLAGDLLGDAFFKGTYECVDESAEGEPFKPIDTYEGAPIYTVSADCDKFYKHCPPYQSGKAISCVVCSK